MTNQVNTSVLDGGLTDMVAKATGIYICSTQPTDYTTATSTNALGNKVFGAGSTLTGPTAGAPAGSRKVSSVAVTNGSVTTGGTAGFWAIVDSVNSRMLATGALAATQVVTAGNTFTLPSFDTTLNGQ